MHIRILALYVLALLWFVTPSSATSSANCATFSDGVSGIKCTFSPSVTAGTFDFGPDGVITFQFDTVLRPGFELDVSAVEDTSPNYTTPSFTGPDFPAGTVCIPYNGFGGNGGRCVRYNVTGANGGRGSGQRGEFMGRFFVL